jgi:hypothetical protein
MGAKMTPAPVNSFAALACYAIATNALSSRLGEPVDAEVVNLRVGLAVHHHHRRKTTMQESKSPNTKSSFDSPGRSALEDGMDRVSEELDQEKVASIKVSTKHRLPKIVRRRMMPLKGEAPGSAPLSSHFPWIKKTVKRSKPFCV